MSDANTETQSPAAVRSKAMDHALNLIRENGSLSNILVEGIYRILSSAQDQASVLERKQTV